MTDGGQAVIDCGGVGRGFVIGTLRVCSLVHGATSLTHLVVPSDGSGVRLTLTGVTVANAVVTADSGAEAGAGVSVGTGASLSMANGGIINAANGGG